MIGAQGGQTNLLRAIRLLARKNDIICFSHISCTVGSRTFQPSDIELNAAALYAKDVYGIMGCVWNAR
jgi:hypothetical protein